jgi:uncharacterized protein
VRQSRLGRAFWLSLGVLSVALGLIGIVVPIMPTVPFLILAAFCFARSSPTLEEKLIRHPIYGPSIRDWRERGAISKRGKWMATVAFGLSIPFGLLTLSWPWVVAPPLIAAVCLSWIWTRPL